MGEWKERKREAERGEGKEWRGMGRVYLHWLGLVPGTDRTE